MISFKERFFVFFAIIFISVGNISALSFKTFSKIQFETSNLNYVARDEFDDLMKSAFDLYTKKKFDDALAICARAKEMKPSDFRPFYIAGIVYMAQWKMKSASEEFALAISLNPKEKRLHLLKAKADRFRNAKEDSIASAQKAIELDPNYAEAYIILGEAYSIGGSDKNKSIEAYKMAIKLKPELVQTYCQLGMQLTSKDDKGAEDAYKTGMNIDPQKMACRFDLGRLLVKQGRLAEARVIWNERTSDTDNTFPNFITVLERAEKLEQAKVNLAKKPNDPETLLQMGLMVMDGESWVVDGRQERAIVYFKKALDINPTFAKAQYAICKAYVEIADTFKEKNKDLDLELAKLRKMDAKLADEIVEYRKTYSGGLKTTSGTINQ